MRLPFWMERVWHSKANEFVILKIFINLPIGLILGVIFYYGIIQRLGFQSTVDQVLKIGIIASMGIGWAISRQIRATSVLLLPSIFTGEGRFMLTAISYSLLLTGPIANTMDNAGEVLRGVGCTFNFLKSQHAERLALLNEPLQAYSKKVGADLSSFDRKLNELINNMAPPKFSVKSFQNPEAFDEEGFEDYEQYVDEDSDDKTVENRNEIDDMKDTAQSNCREMFDNAESKCVEEYKMVVDRCSNDFEVETKFVRKRQEAICGALDESSSCSTITPDDVKESQCSSDKAFDPNLANEFDSYELLRSRSRENVDIHLQGVVYDRSVNQTSQEDVAKGIQHEFDQNRRFLELISLAVQRLLAFSFIFVIRKAWVYHNKYRTDIQFDNVYITQYFKNIDSSRKEQNKRTLLPLKSHEAKQIAIVSTKKLLAAEKKKLIKNVSSWLLRLVVAGLIFGADSILFQVLEVIQAHGTVEIHQKGHSSLTVYVSGVGAVSDTVRGMVEGLNFTYNSNNVLSNDVCLPRAQKLPWQYLAQVLLIAATQLLLALFEAYGLRLRRVIAAAFYRKREKTRQLYLYNDMLKKRKGYLHHARHAIRRNVVQKELERKPAFSLPCFKTSKTKCIVCATKMKKEDAHQCESEGCGATYCKECWQDVKEFCLSCTHPAQLDEVLSKLTVKLEDLP